MRDVRQNKGSILKASVEYIKKLKSDQDRRTFLEEKCRLQEYQNKKLLLKLQVKRAWPNPLAPLRSTVGGEVPPSEVPEQEASPFSIIRCTPPPPLPFYRCYLKTALRRKRNKSFTLSSRYLAEFSCNSAFNGIFTIDFYWIFIEFSCYSTGKHILFYTMNTNKDELIAERFGSTFRIEIQKHL